jgi:hypothetical protein
MVFDKLGGVEPLFMATVDRLIEMGGADLRALRPEPIHG